METKYDLAVAYRIYPKISKSPFCCSNDKLKLSELCLKSFKASLTNLKVKMYVILDNCPVEYDILFQKYFDTQDLELIHEKGVGNEATFGMQIDLLLKQTDADYIYFAEDDYVYLPNQFHEMIDLMKSDISVDFVTAYDHLDYYNSPNFEKIRKIRINGKRHWQNIEATCCTFLTSKNVLTDTAWIIRNYAKTHDEGIFWFSLTKTGVSNPFKSLKFYRSDHYHFISFARTWKYGWKQICFKKKRQLLCPIPSIATHVEKGFLAPNIDWEKVVQSYSK